MSEEKKEVMTLNKFGLCPLCGKQMYMLESHYCIYGLIPNGKYPNRLIERENDITYACECGYRAKMVMTADGVYPRDYRDFKSIEDKAISGMKNPIGEVCSEEEKK